MERDHKLKKTHNSLPFIVFLTTLTLIFQYFSLFSLVASSSDSCSCTLNINVPILFDTSNLHCVSVWDSQGFILRVSQPYICILIFIFNLIPLSSLITYIFGLLLKFFNFLVSFWG